MTVKEISELWIDIHCMNLSCNTAENCHSFFECHIFPFFAESEINEINERNILDWIRGLLEHGNTRTGTPLSQNSVVKGLSYFKKVFEFAIDKKIIDYNPAKEIILAKVDPKKYDIYKKEKVEKLISAARPKWLGDMILLAYHTGMRRGEIYGLQWDDIDFETRTLRVQRSAYAKRPGPVNINNPKTPKSKREIMFDNAVTSMLLKRMQLEPHSEWVFTNKIGNICSPCYHSKYFRQSCINAGIPPRRFHDLRHTHITELVEAGIPLPVIQQRAGHSDIRTTMHYTHINVSMQTIVVNFLENRIT